MNQLKEVVRIMKRTEDQLDIWASEKVFYSQILGTGHKVTGKGGTLS